LISGFIELYQVSHFCQEGTTLKEKFARWFTSPFHTVPKRHIGKQPEPGISGLRARNHGQNQAKILQNLTLTFPRAYRLRQQEVPVCRQFCILVGWKYFDGTAGGPGTYPDASGSAR
jgi:hypothetical protein